MTPQRRRLPALGAVYLALFLVLSACNQSSPVPPDAEVAIVGLEATTYVNDSVTFDVAVVGGAYDTLELRRDGELFQVLTEPSFTWDVGSVPEASYTFVARVRRGPDVYDSAPKVVVVDRTAPSVALSVTPEQDPVMAGEGQVTLEATAADDVSLLRVELLDDEEVLASGAAELLELTLTPERGTHSYRARAVDRAGNAASTAVTTVPAYVRQTQTLVSEEALDGCVSAGYEPGLFTRHFDVASCNWTTSWSTLHFFSFDRADFPGALVENATLRFHRADSFDPFAYLAGVSYTTTDDAPPTAFIYPFVSTVPETQVTLDTSVGTTTQSLDVTALVQADASMGRERSQLRLRTYGASPGALGGSGYFAEIGDERVPRLELELLVP